MLKRSVFLVVAAALVVAGHAQIGFTYQGRLEVGGVPANGPYDFQFALYSVPSGGTPLAIAGRDDLTVTRGVFTTEIFGFDFHLNGGSRFIEVRVRQGAGSGDYTALAPRVALAKAPYAVYAFGPWIPTGNNVLYYTQGNVGIGDFNPAATLTVGNGDKFQVAGATGSVRFTDDMATVQFPATSLPNPPMMAMFDSGTENANRMVLAHSAAIANTGLEFRDADDSFHFLSAGQSALTVRLTPGGLGVGIGETQPGTPLTFGSGFGNKISLYGNSGPHYGFGVQPDLLQVYADSMAADIAFGFGSSGSFTERARIKGSGQVLINAPTALGRLTVNGGTGTGIYAVSSGSAPASGVYGVSTNLLGNAVTGEVADSVTQYAIWGRTTGNNAYAGYFNGRVQVIGPLAVSGTKAFTIDHPLDPYNKYLSHYSIESPEVLNVYRGGAVFDVSGRAVVQLPDYFEAINVDFQYHLTPVGAPMPNLHIERKVEGRTFVIGGGIAGKEVSWMLTARRNDAHLRAHPAPVEWEKPEPVRGSLLDAELLGLPREESEAFRRGQGENE